MLYKPHTSTKEKALGIEMKPHARIKFEKLSGRSVQLCRLFSDVEFLYLAATPDGLVDEDSILEIKCPYAARDTKSPVEAVNNELLKYCNVINKNQISLKNEYKYWYQIMGQLQITGRKKCYYVIHTHHWMTIQEINYDDEF
uniref:YqaJ viral recombinase domain-containing protein n=1 Tax=Schizaphis graminum TaxID=13262 RepID=A0A2S2NER6_SCHGA